MGQGVPKVCSAVPSFKSTAFHNWGHIKSTVFAAEISGFQELQQRRQNRFEMILTTTVIFLKFGQLIFKCATSCFEVQGGRFEHFLQTSGGHKLKTML